MTIEDRPRRKEGTHISGTKSGAKRTRTVRIGEIVEFLEYLAPPTLAPSPAPFGLQVGSHQSEIRTVIVTPLPTLTALRRAATEKAGLLLCAAPLITAPLTSLCWDDPVGARVAQLVRQDLALYALSSAYAAAPAGFDACLAERLGLAASGALMTGQAEPLLKLVVFVPPTALERVRNAAGDAGAGAIGAYVHCAFETRGTGTFLPQEGANPAVGRVGRRESVDESRLEMVVPERELQGVIAAVLEAHPYEEVAYDVYPLRNPGIVHGRGRIGELPLQVSLDTVLAQTSDALGLEAVTSARCTNRQDALIGTLAVASGTDREEGLLWAAHRQQAGALIVGGLAPTDAMLADSTRTTLIEVGFAPSVTPGLQRLAIQMEETFTADGLRTIFV